MDRLLLHAGVFALFTFVVYLVCMWFVRQEERGKEQRRSGRAGPPAGPPRSS